MNSYTISARYTRMAACAFFVSLCGQTVRASEINLWAAGGTAISAVSAIIRYANPPVSVLGVALDGACTLGNGYAAFGGKPCAPSAIWDLGCLTGLLLQFTRLVPALTVGINDPLETVRTVFSLLNIAIIGHRVSNYNSLKQSKN